MQSCVLHIHSKNVSAKHNYSREAEHANKLVFKYGIVNMVPSDFCLS